MNGNYVFCVVCDCWSPDGRWCCLTMFGTPVVAIDMQLLEDGERLRVIHRKHNFPPSVAKPTIDKLQEIGECIRRQGQSRSRMITPMQHRFLVLLYRSNHTSTAKALDTDSCHATEVHLPNHIVRHIFNYDCMRARRPAQCQLHTAHTVQCDSTLFVSIITDRDVTGGQCIVESGSLSNFLSGPIFHFA